MINGFANTTANTSANTANNNANNTQLSLTDVMKKIDPYNRSSGVGSHNAHTLMSNLGKAIHINPLEGLMQMLGGDFEPMKPENMFTPKNTSGGGGGQSGPGTNGPASGGF